jgi:hypothetical protein
MFAGKNGNQNKLSFKPSHELHCKMSVYTLLRVRNNKINLWEGLRYWTDEHQRQQNSYRTDEKYYFVPTWLHYLNVYIPNTDNKQTRLIAINHGYFNRVPFNRIPIWSHEHFLRLSHIPVNRGPDNCAIQWFMDECRPITAIVIYIRPYYGWSFLEC